MSQPTDTSALELPEYLLAIWEGIKAGYLKQCKQQGQKRLGFLGIGSRVAEYYDKQQRQEARQRQRQIAKGRLLDNADNRPADVSPVDPASLTITRWGCRFTSEMFVNNQRPKTFFYRMVNRLFHVEDYYRYCFLLKDLEPLGLTLNNPSSFNQVDYRNEEIQAAWWYKKINIATFAQSLWHKQMMPLFNASASSQEVLTSFNRTHDRLTRFFNRYNDRRIGKGKARKTPREISEAIDLVWKAIGYQLGFNVRRVTRLLSERFFPASTTENAESDQGSPKISVAFQASGTPLRSVVPVEPESSNSVSPSSEESEHDVSEPMSQVSSLQEPKPLVTTGDSLSADATPQPETTLILVVNNNSKIPTTEQSSRSELMATEVSAESIFLQDYSLLELLMYQACLALWEHAHESVEVIKTKQDDYLNQVRDKKKELAFKYHSDREGNETLAPYLSDVVTMLNHVKVKINSEFEKVMTAKKDRACGKLTQSAYQELCEGKQIYFEAQKEKIEKRLRNELENSRRVDQLAVRVAELVRRVEHMTQADKEAAERHEKWREEERQYLEELQRKVDKSEKAQENMQQKLDKSEKLQEEAEKEAKKEREKSRKEREYNRKVQEKIQEKLDKSEKAQGKIQEKLDKSEKAQGKIQEKLDKSEEQIADLAGMVRLLLLAERGLTVPAQVVSEASEAANSESSASSQGNSNIQSRPASPTLRMAGNSPTLFSQASDASPTETVSFQEVTHVSNS